VLFIVSTPIGNPDDITVRALRTLGEATAVVCEERRIGSRLLHTYQLENEIVDLNEHTERERIPELIERLKRGETLALISDHGTPLLADPGARFTERAIAEGIPISAVPGTSSLLAALVISGLPMDQFRFAGMLPVKTEARRAALGKLSHERHTWVVLDAPYRLAAVLEDMRTAVGANRQVVVACELTRPTEKVVRGAAGQVVEHFRIHPFKGEFVIVVAGKGNT